jgi:hypothetical protein
MKNKPNKKTSINDVVLQQADKELKKSGKTSVGYSGKSDNAGPIPIIQSTTPVVNDKHALQLEKDIKEYNENIGKLDPEYKSLAPISKIIVRCYHIETERTESGLILEPKLEVEVPTQAGYGIIGTVKSPYAYQKKAIIVAVPERYKNDENTPFKVGAIAQLSTTPLRPIKKGKDVDFDLPNGFTHHSYQHPVPPKSIKNKHYGYLLVSPHEIDAICPEKS